MIALLIAVPLLPLLAAGSALIFGHRFPLATSLITVCSISLSLGTLAILYGTSAAVSGTWFEIGRYNVTVGIELTGLTWFAAVVVAATALGVGIYSLGYMARDPHRGRFFAELGLFVGAMLTLVLANSLILLFAAWELVGLASYLLIGFHYDEKGVAAAASKAFLMTRIGDMGLLLGWLLAFSASGTTDLAALLNAVKSGEWAPAFATMAVLLLLAGAIGKSAQLPLTGWLPDAMIGPTPVSALLHSATMVAAGIFLLLRLYPLVAAAPGALEVVFGIGATTAVFAGIVATAQMDLKRVLAWSTSSQLGEMMVAVGLGGPIAAALHLATHAAFKSTLFMAAGTVQEQTGTRDMRRLGGLIRTLPITGGVFVLAALALAAFPPLSGFWSEDMILAVAERQGLATAMLIIVLVFLAGLYIGRATVLTFFRRDAEEPREVREPDRLMICGMAALAIPAVGLGLFLFGNLQGLLALGAVSESSWIWRIAALIATVGGLVLGGGLAWRKRAASLFGTLPHALESALFVLTMAPARLTFRLAERLQAIEVWLDRAAQTIGSTSARLAIGSRTIEAGLDRSAYNLQKSIWSLARQTDDVEALGFSRGGDKLAAEVAGGGEHLRALQTGKLYLYTLGLFIWATAVLISVAIVLWL
jgi:NADH-quinone oxidoreductase subunit L